MEKRKQNVVIFPYDCNFSPILRHNSLIDCFNISGVVSPHGWGFEGLDAGEIDGGSKINIVVTTNFEEAICNCDTIIIPQPYLSISSKEDIFPNIIYAIKKRKNIINLFDLEEESIKEIQSMCTKYNVNFINYNTKKTECHTFFSEMLYKIVTPVIFILGTTERTSKFEIQLALREKIINMGYMVSQIGTREYCELLGFHSFPSFMHNTSLSEVQKIILFNRYVKKIEQEEKPDLILIGIPGGIMKVNNTYTNKFGIFAYEISQAVTPDIAILSTLYENFELRYFEKMSNTIKYRLGFEIDYFNLASTQFDWRTSKESDKEVFITLDTSFIDSKIQKYGSLSTPVFNVLNNGSIETVTSQIINKLCNYAEIGSM